MNLSDPKVLAAFLDRHRLSARKGLGQHFLCSSTVVERVLSELAGMSGVLEIGPGPGVLTGPMSSAGHEVVALEIDPEMAEVLRESAPSARVIRTDALKADLGALLSSLPAPQAIVSNLPYYITAPLVEKIAGAREGYDLAVLMTQKEVAERFTALPGDSARGSISVYLQALFEIDVIAKAPRSAFLPPPKVDSAILRLAPRRDAEYGEKFFDFVRLGFSQPRKTLVNNTSEASREQVREILVRMGIDSRVRPHELTLGSWKTLHEGLAR